MGSAMSLRAVVFTSGEALDAVGSVLRRGGWEAAEGRRDGGLPSRVERGAADLLVTRPRARGKRHRSGARTGRPMVCINCAAIPDPLLESELFGYERGAFTGAQTSTPGKLEQAEGGTVFFDEIGDMSAYAQAKILRAIESREVHRL